MNTDRHRSDFGFLIHVIGDYLWLKDKSRFRPTLNKRESLVILLSHAQGHSQ
jgi:hypothetical protein